MANPRAAIDRIRECGGNVLIDAGRLRIINREKLPAAALEYVKSNAKELGEYLDREAAFDERAAIMEYDGGLRRVDAGFLTKLLMSSPPEGADRSEWSWFVGQASQIVERSLPRRAA
jgi:hypothetical protein